MFKVMSGHQFLHYFQEKYAFVRDTATKLLDVVGCEVASDPSSPMVVLHRAGVPVAVVELVPDKNHILLVTVQGQECYHLPCLGERNLYSALLRITERLQSLFKGH
jgi:hypothetical protein